jgi:hypothetical protein
MDDPWAGLDTPPLRPTFNIIESRPQDTHVFNDRGSRRSESTGARTASAEFPITIRKHSWKQVAQGFVPQKPCGFWRLFSA